MKLETLIELLPMLEGVKRGETWQVNHTGKWQDLEDFEDIPIRSNSFYRKKPEPRVVWVPEYSGGRLSSALFTSKDLAKQYAPTVCVGVVKFIEVPE